MLFLRTPSPCNNRAVGTGDARVVVCHRREPADRGRERACSGLALRCKAGARGKGQPWRVLRRIIEEIFPNMNNVAPQVLLVRFCLNVDTMIVESRVLVCGHRTARTLVSLVRSGLDSTLYSHSREARASRTRSSSHAPERAVAACARIRRKNIGRRCTARSGVSPPLRDS